MGNKQWVFWPSTGIEVDSVNWSNDYDTAFDAWHALADAMNNGESVYMQRFDENGDPDEDFPHELRCEDGQVLEYHNGQRMWA